MANGVQLATAYISLNVRTDGIKKQVESALNGVGSTGRSAGVRIGSNVASGIRSAMAGSAVGGALLNAESIFLPFVRGSVGVAAKAGKMMAATLGTTLKMALGAVGIGGLLGTATAIGEVLTAGLARLQTMQQSRIQLSLTLSPQDISKLQSQVAEVVKGTNVTLDEAMKAVPKAINAGLNTDQVRQYVKDLADAAAATGGQADTGWLDEIFSKIRADGKLATDQIDSLNSAGLDIRGTLKKAFGWDDKTLDKNLKNKKVGIDQVQQAIQKVYGSVDAGNGKSGLAQLLGTKTLDGSIKAAKASLSRIGADFISAIVGKDPSEDPLETYAMGINKITEGLKGIEAWISDNREGIHSVFVNAKNAIGTVITKSKELVDWFKRMWQGAQDFGSKVGGAFDKAKDAIGRVKTSLTNVFDDVKKKFDSVFGPDGWFAKQFDRLAGIVDKVRDVLGLGPATANAATTPTNTGPSAPTALPGGGMRGSFGGTGSMSTSGQLSTGGGKGGVGGMFPIPEFNKPSAANLQEPRKVGSDKGLLPETIGLKDYLTTAFPEISDVGGYRDTDYTPFGVINEHSSGKAFDIMVPKDFMDPKTGRPTPEGIAWGDRVLKEALAKGASVLWKQTQFDPDGNTSGMPDRGDNTQNHWDHLHVLQGSYANYASGGHVWGSGTATSDSIPAMLSNGEHVLTADDVKKMGGQQGVYAFRQMLQAGMIPGFAPGGAVDPSVVDSAQGNLADLNNQYQVLQAQLNEAIQSGEATPSQMLDLQNKLDKTKRDLDNAAADLPIIMGGGTPPDRSKQNRVYDVTDQLEMLQQQLADQKEAGDPIPYSQQLQQNYQLESLKKERGQAIADLQGTGQGKDYGAEFVRSLGFIPASAGNTGVAGTSSLSGFINMGNSVVSGVIDTGVNLANQAVSAAIAAGAAAGSFGSAAAAAPAAQMAASYGIQLAGNQAKRISSYWFGLAGIGADALLEQLSPFGMPRWLGYDYGNFAPNVGIQDAALGTLESMGSDAITKHFSGQGNPTIPADPTAGTNTAPSGPAAGTLQMTAPGATTQGQVGAPNTLDTNGQFNLDVMRLGDPNGAGGNGGGGSWAKGGAIGVYDNGGVLKPGQLAFNASRTPESILTKQQWNAMAANASTRSRDNAPLVQNLYAQDMQDAIRQLEKVKRRDMMQYAGRP